MRNAHRGEVTLPGLGTLRYDWDGLARLIGEFGQDFDSVVAKASASMDVDTIAKAVAIGLGGDVTAEDVKRASPPIVPAVQAVMRALNLAFHGDEKGAAPADQADANPRAKISSRKPAKSRSGRG